MKEQLEALLFATDGPLTMQRLHALLPQATTKDLRGAVQELAREYDEQKRAFTVVEFGGGWQIATRPEYAPLIEKLLRGRRFARLSKAGLEVLAVIAYRQPVTRLEVEEVRGVQSSGVLSTLLERNLVTVVGRASTVGNPLLYGTTREFLNYLGLRGLGQLPELPTLEGVIDNREALKRLAEQLGHELGDEDLAHWEAGSAPAEAAGGDVDSQDPDGVASLDGLEPDFSDADTDRGEIWDEDPTGLEAPACDDTREDSDPALDAFAEDGEPFDERANGY